MKRKSNKMQIEKLNAKFSDSFETMSPKFKQIATYLLQNPDEVALSSTREISSKLGLNAGTLVRFSQHHGFAGFPELRQVFKDHLRQSSVSFVSQAKELQSKEGFGSENKIIGSFLSSQTQNISQVYDFNSSNTLEQVAALLLKKDKVFICGLRMCFAPAFSLAYRCKLIRPNVYLSDGIGGTESDALRHFGPKDVVLTLGLEPYSSQTVASAKFAQNAKSETICITDKPLSPLARHSNHVITFPSEGPSVLGSIIAINALIETIFAMMIAKGGQKTLNALSKSEAQLKEFSSYL